MPPLSERPDAPRRVVIACESLIAGNGGIARVDRMIARIFREEPERFAPEFHVFRDSCGSEDIRCYGGSRFRFTLGLWRAMLRPGLVFYDAAYYAKIHRRWPRSNRRPFMIFLHGIEVWEKARAGSIAACRRADALVANSRHTRDRAERLHGAFARARLCWLGTETSEPVAGAGCPPAGPPVVLAVGRMETRENYKGHRELIDAWPAVLARFPDARLKIVGRGSLLPELQRLAAERQVAHRVDFAGFVPESEMAACYAGATIFALPSRGEGFGLVYVEAMRHGLPVIASVHDAGAEVVEAGRTGLLANLDTPGDLAGKVCHLLAQSEEARRMGLAGRERWQAHFTFDAFRGRFLSVWDEFAAAAAPAASG